MAENELYEAASIDDTATLQRLLEKDPFLLDRVSFTCINKTPLHVATMKGNLRFVQEILNINLELAELLDFQQSSPLHIASAKGYLDIAKILLANAPEMCLSQDFRGKNPLHLAVIKGHVRVLAELVRVCPLAAREKVDGGETVLHVCVKYDRLECLRILVPILNEGIVNAKDHDGDTIMHMALRDKQIEIIKYLVETNKIDVNSKNSKGQTVLDVLDETSEDGTNSDIRRILQPALCKSRNAQNKSNGQTVLDILDETSEDITNSDIRRTLQPALCKSRNGRTKQVSWLTKTRDSIMVVAILIATMAFQAGVTPPGGLWQDDLTHDSQGHPLLNPHHAGYSVMSYNDPEFFWNYIRANTLAFISSLSIIWLLISGLPFRSKFFMCLLMITMWMTVTSIAGTYGLAILAITPKTDRRSLRHVVGTGTIVWCVVMGIFLVGNMVCLIHKWLKKRGIVIWPLARFRNSAEVRVEHYQNGRQESV